MKTRRTMVEAKTDPSMRRQCELLGVNRSSLYYEPVEPDADELALMRRLDELHLKYPFYGSRKLTQALKREGQDINPKRVQRLMRLMGLESTAPKPNTSKPSPEHAKYPYLLRNLKVSRVNQAWASDITYIPMAHGCRGRSSGCGVHPRVSLLHRTDESGLCLAAWDGWVHCE